MSLATQQALRIGFMANLEFYRHLQKTLGGTLHGNTGSWEVPIAIFKDSRGFDESLWVNAVPETLIAYRFSGANVVSHVPNATGVSGPGRDFALEPQGEPSWFECHGQISFGHVYLPNAYLDRASEALGQQPLSRRLRSDLVFKPDAILSARVCKYFKRGVDGVDPATVLEMDARALLLVDRLLALHGDLRPQPILQGLSVWRLRTSCDYLVANMSTNVSLEDVANQVGLSTMHFAREFAKSTGVPPFRWLQERRLELARHLLTVGQLSMLGIALEVGMTAASFSTAFKRATGVSPRAYRQQYGHKESTPDAVGILPNKP